MARRACCRCCGRSAAPAARKLLIGFSDITALHVWLAAQGRISVHGPVLTQLGRLSSATHERLFALLESAVPAAPLEGTDTYVAGVAEGRLLGGNLSVLSRMLGTAYMPVLDDAVLLLEDQGERPYRLDRMWTHLQLAGVFERVRGIVLGTFTQCEEPDAPYTQRRGTARTRPRHRPAVRGGLPHRARRAERARAAGRARTPRRRPPPPHVPGSGGGRLEERSARAHHRLADERNRPGVGHELVVEVMPVLLRIRARAPRLLRHPVSA